MVDTPKPIYQVFPVYPYELRSKGVQGEVKLQLLIDKKGVVKSVSVVKSLHPYLDYAAARAFRQWKFMPIKMKKGSTALASIFAFDFSPEKYVLIDRSVSAEERNKKDMDYITQNRLQNILNDCAEYCRKLNGSALDFVCEESIRETHQYIELEEMPKLSETKQERWGDRSYFGLFRTFKKNYSIRSASYKYLCDYQLIKTGDSIKEQRMILKEGRKNISASKKKLEEMRFLVLRPLFAGIQTLGQNSQEMFDYSIIDEDKIGGVKTYIIEAVPLYRNIGSVEIARIWVNKQNSQILKVVINGLPLEGFDDVWQDTTWLAITPESTITHIYKLERNGVMFPIRSSVHVEYPPVGLQERIEKINLDMRYDKYKYFTVETEHRIIK